MFPVGAIAATQAPALPSAAVGQASASRSAGAALPTPGTMLDPDQFNPITSTTLPLENGERIVMRVNSQHVTWDDFIAQVRIAGGPVYAQHPGKEGNIASALMGPLFEELITQSLYNDFADKHHLVPEVREVQNGTRKLIERPDRRMTQALKRLSSMQIQTLVRDSLVREKVDKYIGDRATSAPPTQAQLTSFTAKFQPTTSPMTILRARHIVVRATPDMTEFNINDAKAKADEIRAKLRDKDTTAPVAGSAPVDFVTAARQYSQDRFTAYLGGDLGYFRAGSMYPSINEALEKLESGEISPVIRTPVGFHIVQLTERRDSNLVLQFDHWRRKEAVGAWLTKARDNADVESFINP